MKNNLGKSRIDAKYIIWFGVYWIKVNSNIFRCCIELTKGLELKSYLRYYLTFNLFLSNEYLFEISKSEIIAHYHEVNEIITFRINSIWNAFEK